MHRWQQRLPLRIRRRDSKCGKRTTSYDHKVRQSRTRDREWNIDVYVPDTESGEYGSRCSYRCRDHRYL